ncbi:MAG: hypothetical protein KGJ21_09320, partial [Pseudomonadota bacterium]|nr:hypothetical protein [Pseudomonadota bacterium]
MPEKTRQLASALWYERDGRLTGERYVAKRQYAWRYKTERVSGGDHFIVYAVDGFRLRSDGE